MDMQLLEAQRLLAQLQFFIVLIINHCQKKIHVRRWLHKTNFPDYDIDFTIILTYMHITKQLSYFGKNYTKEYKLCLVWCKNSLACGISPKYTN